MPKKKPVIKKPAAKKAVKKSPRSARPLGASGAAVTVQNSQATPAEEIVNQEATPRKDDFSEQLTAVIEDRDWWKNKALEYQEEYQQLNIPSFITGIAVMVVFILAFMYL